MTHESLTLRDNNTFTSLINSSQLSLDNNIFANHSDLSQASFDNNIFASHNDSSQALLNNKLSTDNNLKCMLVQMFGCTHSQTTIIFAPRFIIYNCIYTKYFNTSQHKYIIQLFSLVLCIVENTTIVFTKIFML